jgi:phage gp36-like protein
MFATIQDLYLRFGKANVLRIANFDAFDETDPNDVAKIEPRLTYFLEQAYEAICDALRQGTYDPDTIEKPYPQTLVNLNCETAFIRLYRTKHSDDETVSDAYRILEEECNRLIRDIRTGAVRFRKGIQRAMSIPASVNASLAGKARRPNVTSTLPGGDGLRDPPEKKDTPQETPSACNHRTMSEAEVIALFNVIFHT